MKHIVKSKDSFYFCKRKMNTITARKTLSILKEKEFSYFILTRFIVIFSLFMQTTTVSYLIYTLTKDPLSLGLLGLAELIPALSLAIVAGYFVDKLEKRTVYLICLILYFFNAIFIALICSNYFIHSHSVKMVEWLIYGAMFLSGCVRSFLAPSSFSLLPLLVSKSSIPQAVTWSSTSWLLGSVLGPLVGGIVMASFGISITLTIVIGLLAVAVISMLQVQKKPFTASKNVGFAKGLSEGFKFIFTSKIILAVLSLDLFAVLFGGAEALLPVFSNEILNVGEVGYGWLRSAHGIGSILLLFVLTYLPLQSKVGQKLLWCVLGFGICIILFGISKNVYFSFFVLMIGGLFDGVSVVIRQSILQLKTPDEIKGRVSSINMMFISSSNELGAFESGVTARLMGTIPAVVFGGIMTLVVVGITYFKVPSLQKIKLDEHSE